MNVEAPIVDVNTPTPELVSLEKGHGFSLEGEEQRIRWARRFIARLEGVGQGLGYGIFHGGTLIRDIDVVAGLRSSVATNPASPDVFVRELIHRMGLRMGNYGDTLFGHRYFALWAPGHEDHQIDLKIIRPVSVDDGPLGPEQLEPRPVLTTESIPDPTGALEIAREALERIAAPHDCGCKPCVGQCRSESALAITVDVFRDEASQALASIKSTVGGG